MEIIIFLSFLAVTTVTLFLAIFFDNKRRCEELLLEIYTGEWKKREEEIDALQARCDELENLLSEYEELESKKKIPPLPRVEIPFYYDD